MEHSVVRVKDEPSAAGGFSFLFASTLFLSLSAFSFSFSSFLKMNQYQIA